MGKQTPLCPHCRSPHVRVKAFAVWDATKEKWEYHPVDGEAACAGCDSEIDPDDFIWKTLKEETRNG